jgi:1-phosphatidylinositol-3-phosphate 5-kinase
MKNYHDDQGSQNVSKNGSYGSDIAGGQRRYASDSGIDIAGGGTDEDHLYGHERDDSADTRRTREKGPDAPRTLLDGDFLETTFGRPMPMHDRAKEVFHMSILNDTLFLSIINVLDYSILVGIDEEKMELVVGIIDFMRQYDILKQMERVGKSIPMVVGSEAPTIIQPPLYKARFTNAMERYFMTVPSKWTTI